MDQTLSQIIITITIWTNRRDVFDEMSWIRKKEWWGQFRYFWKVSKITSMSFLGEQSFYFVKMLLPSVSLRILVFTGGRVHWGNWLIFVSWCTSSKSLQLNTADNTLHAARCYCTLLIYDSDSYLSVGGLITPCLLGLWGPDTSSDCTLILMTVLFNESETTTLSMLN